MAQPFVPDKNTRKEKRNKHLKGIVSIFHYTLFVPQRPRRSREVDKLKVCFEPDNRLVGTFMFELNGSIRLFSGQTFSFA